MFVATFPPRKRLDQRGVLAILKRSKRVIRPEFELRLGVTATNTAHRDARLAISVPKRQLKSAVARNRVKRLVREIFRSHAIAAAPLDILVTYRAKYDARLPKQRAALREALCGLLTAAFADAPPALRCDA